MRNVRTSGGLAHLRYRRYGYTIKGFNARNLVTENHVINSMMYEGNLRMDSKQI